MLTCQSSEECWQKAPNVFYVGSYYSYLIWCWSTFFTRLISDSKIGGIETILAFYCFHFNKKNVSKPGKELWSNIIPIQFSSSLLHSHNSCPPWQILTSFFDCTNHLASLQPIHHCYTLLRNPVQSSVENPYDR